KKRNILKNLGKKLKKKVLTILQNQNLLNPPPEKLHKKVLPFSHNSLLFPLVHFNPSNGLILITSATIARTTKTIFQSQ
uniref:hypothetical protein n=1 Tax=Methanobrevibacter curvatus TaxID=49547 RepID=UPI001B8094A1